MSAHAWFNRVWYTRDVMPPGWLLPLSVLYAGVVALRRFAYRRGLRRRVRIGCPVVVVGNLTVGGTGKTPLVCWLTLQLAKTGLRPGIVTRGYGGSIEGVRLLSAEDRAEVVGDEPLLLVRRTGVPVAIGRDRPAAAQLLVAAGCDIVVSDDGLQHYALARDCEILVIDGDRRFGNGWLLPAGPLREPPSRATSVDAIVVNGCRAQSDEEFGMRLDAGEALAVRGVARRGLDSFARESVHAVAGIGHPERFFNMLRAHGVEVVGHALDDHADIRREDIEFPDDRLVLMTEKDAVKCAAIAGERHWYVPVSARFEEQAARRLLDTIMAKLPQRQTR